MLALHRDDDSYLEYVNRPFFRDSRPLRDLSTDGLLDAFDAIFRRSKQDAIRRNPYLWGRKYEERRRFEVRAGLFVARIGKLCFWRHHS